MPRGEGTKKISDLFLKYQKNLKAPQKHVVDNFCEVVEDVLGVKLKIEQVKFNSFSRTITLSTKGPLKSEILLHREEILLHLKGRLGTSNSPTTIL